MSLLKLMHLLRSHLLALCLAVLLGALGHLVAILIPVVGVYSLLYDMQYLYLILVFGLLRGFLRYIEQYFNHLIAFKILADVRHAIFKKLRSLGPARMDSKNRGDLISMVTTDVELLEVFFAHTVSPILIALIICSIMLSILPYKIITLFAYVLIGLFIPICMMRLGAKSGEDYRSLYASNSTKTYEYVQGYDDLVQFDQVESWNKKSLTDTKALNLKQEKLSRLEVVIKSSTDLVLWITSCFLIIVMAAMGFEIKIIVLSFVIHISSFGPVLACAQVVNNLFQTSASSSRIVHFLEEPLVVKPVTEGLSLEGVDMIEINDLNFSYDGNHEVIKDLSLKIDQGLFIGIQGDSGSGKSTLLKLLMRFMKSSSGSIHYNDHSLETINTSDLLEKVSMLGQFTDTFSGSISDNIKIVKRDADDEELIKASKKANTHDFIMSLENGYDTEITNMGTNFSTGEKQRMGLARLFLYDADLILLDEPSSNLDALSEAIMVESLLQFKGKKTVVIVSHNESALKHCDIVYTMSDGVLQM